jgi:DNA-binding GntR family transcriptional regulator
VARHPDREVHVSSALVGVDPVRGGVHQCAFAGRATEHGAAPTRRTAKEMTETEPLSERVYALLKDDVSSGIVSDHVRLDFAELAARYEVSTTPVREAAMRLLGEGLIETHPRGGLRPIPMRESELRALIELHGQVTTLALRWSGGAATAIDAASSGYGRARRFFVDLARATGNDQFVRVMEQLEDRLERYRRLEHRLLPDSEAELASLEEAVSSPPLLRRLLRRYHRRRQAIVVHAIMLAATEDVDLQGGG